MKKLVTFFSGTILIIGFIMIHAACMNPVDFDPYDEFIPSRPAPANNDNPAALIMTNRSKSVDVTKVVITQPEVSSDYRISFENQPSRLEKKAQYLQPSDKSYHVQIDYKYDAYKQIPEGTGSKKLVVPLPFPKETEITIYRNTDGEVIIYYVDEYGIHGNTGTNTEPDTEDTEEPEEDDMQGEGSSPAYIPERNAYKIAPFAVFNKTKSQNVDIVEFRKGEISFSMTGMGGPIKPKEHNSIGLGKGSWNVVLKYTKNGEQFPLSKTVLVNPDPENPLSILNHCLYFYLNQDGKYAISQIWPPDDLNEEEMIPPDEGFGSGLIIIANNSVGSVKAVSIRSLGPTHRNPITIESDVFDPSVPVEYQKTGLVDVVGTEDFPIEDDVEYLFLISVETDDTGDPQIVERTGCFAHHRFHITIEPEDILAGNAKGAKFIIENATTVKNDETGKGVEIISILIYNKADPLERSFKGITTWVPEGTIAMGRNAIQLVKSDPYMPILPGAEFIVEVNVLGGGLTETITDIPLDEPVLYSTHSIEENERTITITDDYISGDMKNAILIGGGSGGGGGNDPGNSGANFRIINNTNDDYPAAITVIRIRNTRTGAYYDYSSSSFSTGHPIAKGEEATMLVRSSTNMPITNANDKFEAIVTLYANETEITKTLSISDEGILYSDDPAHTARTVTLNAVDLPQVIKTAVDRSVIQNEVNITLQNRVSTWPVDIFSMKLINQDDRSFMIYNGETWEPKHSIRANMDAVQKVKSGTNFKINRNAKYTAEILLVRNNKAYTVRKEITLYGKSNENITIYEYDVPDYLRTADGLKSQLAQEWSYETEESHERESGVQYRSLVLTVTFTNDTKEFPVRIEGVRINRVSTGSASAFSYESFSPATNIPSEGKARLVLSPTENNTLSMPRDGGEYQCTFCMSYGDVRGEFTSPTTFSWKRDQWVIYFGGGRSQSVYDYFPVATTITIRDANVPENLRRAILNSQGANTGAKITIQNNVSSPELEILNVKIANAGNPTVKRYLDAVTWAPNRPIENELSAEQLVMNSSVVPFLPVISGTNSNITVKSDVLINGITYYDIDLNPAPAAKPTLFSDKPAEQNLRTFTLDAIPASAPTTPPTIKDDIANAPDGALIIIDGHEWIKVRSEAYPGSTKPAVLLVYKGVIPGTHRYNENMPGPNLFFPEAYTGNFYRYNTYMQNIVNTWYSKLDSPELKKIHLQLSPSDITTGYLQLSSLSDFNKVKNDPGSFAVEGKNLTRAGTNPDNGKVIAFVPSYKDIKSLKATGDFSNSYTYWLRDVICRWYLPSGWDFFWGAYSTWEHKWLYIVQPNGSIEYKAYDSTAYVRPCVWVRVN